jgi:hypothetical protein
MFPTCTQAEGDRFSASESTIKLCFGTTYQIEVKSWPPVIITSAKLQEVVGPRVGHNRNQFEGWCLLLCGLCLARLLVVSAGMSEYTTGICAAG